MFKGLRKPIFFLAILASILLAIGFALQNNDGNYGRYFIYASAAVFVLCWLTSIADVIQADDLRFFQKEFWLIIVISVPFLGGLFYLLMHRKPNKIVS